VLDMRGKKKANRDTVKRIHEEFRQYRKDLDKEALKRRLISLGFNHFRHSHKRPNSIFLDAPLIYKTTLISNDTYVTLKGLFPRVELPEDPPPVKDCRFW